MLDALIMVDFQKEWTDEKSEYYAGDLSGVLMNTNQMIAFCREKGYRIIFTAHLEKESEGPFREGTENAKLIDSLDVKESDTIIYKNKISPFYKTALEKELEGVKRIVICGILTNLCVRSLAEEAYDRDFEIIVIKDACAAFDEETQEFTFRDLKRTREEIEFLDTDEFISGYQEKNTKQIDIS